MCLILIIITITIHRILEYLSVCVSVSMSFNVYITHMCTYVIFADRLKINFPTKWCSNHNMTARTLSTLRHPDLVLFLGASLDGDTSFFLTEYMEARKDILGW